MAKPKQGERIQKSGKIKLLRVCDTENAWGAGDDKLFTEVIVQLEGSDAGFGFDLHAGDKDLPSRLGMLSVLRDAFINDIPVTLTFLREKGKVQGYATRVELIRK